jgi:membrane protein implicated in regulation of membrane protease activity
MQADALGDAVKEACSLGVNLSRFEPEHEEQFPQMSDWWNSLLIEKQIFYAIGLFSLAILLLQILLTLMGVGHHDADFSGHGDHDTGMGLLTVRTVTAFFVGFGWAGVIMLNRGHSMIAAIAVGAVTGVAFLLTTAFLIHNLLRLQSGGGNVDYNNAIGSVGTVYITVPAAETGGGQIEVTIQGRLMMADAYTKSASTLRPNTKVKVVGLIGGSTLLVEPLTNSTNA